ncbi:thioesterase [Embleya hyalina]|uniref:Thioesterase n=2 Tax=Embleya hyalina TaxID=516124 RepID=A0A401Z091_9ACTN|nr:thioesterase [Embleya hyalina]
MRVGTENTRMRNGAEMKPLPLVCLPFAGVGASIFRTWWGREGHGLSIVPVQLPGREELIDDEPHRDIGAAIDELAPRVLAALRGRTEIAVFGHSMGAFLGYELAHRLIDTADIRVAVLVVSGSHGPHQSRRRQVTGLSDEQFLDGIAEFVGYRPAALDDPEFRELLLPVLRADAEMHERYRPSVDRPLPAPILTVRGSADDMVSAREVGQWQAVTTAPLLTAELPGGHMYPTEHADALLRLIAGTVGQPVGPSR